MVVAFEIHILYSHRVVLLSPCMIASNMLCTIYMISQFEQSIEHQHKISVLVVQYTSQGKTLCAQLECNALIIPGTVL